LAEAAYINTTFSKCSGSGGGGGVSLSQAGITARKTIIKTAEGYYEKPRAKKGWHLKNLCT
jgi:hypothetical protein